MIGKVDKGDILDLQIQILTLATKVRSSRLDPIYRMGTT